MKKVLSIILMALAVTMVFVSCDEPKHEHSYGTKWESDATNHWHECECGEKSDKAAHTFEWKQSEDNTKHYQECKVCGYKTEEAEHKYSEEWSKGESSHWHACECGAKSDETEHTFGADEIKDKKVVCSVCGYEKNVEDATFTVTDEASLKAAAEAEGVKTIKLANEITISTAKIKVSKPLVVDMDKKKLTISAEGGSISLGENATLTVKNIPEDMQQDFSITIENAEAIVFDTDSTKNEVTYYTSLAKAIDKAGAEDVVYLVAELTLTEDITVNKALNLLLANHLLKEASHIKIGKEGSIYVYGAAAEQGSFSGAVAKVGTTTDFGGFYYGALASAVAAIQDSSDKQGTIVLLDNITLSDYVDFGKGEKITLDLNNHNITFAKNTDDKNGWRFSLNDYYTSGAEVTVTGTGTISQNDADQYIFCLTGNKENSSNPVKLTIGKNVTLKGDKAISVFEVDKTNSCYNVTVDVSGTLEGGAAIYVSGNIKNTEGAPVIKIEDSAKITTKKEGETAIYAAGYAEWNIGNVEIKGNISAIEIRAGKLNITGGTYEATSGNYIVTPNDSGTTVTGAVIAVSQHTAKFPIAVTIDGGTFTAADGGKQLAIVNPQNNDVKYTKNVVVTVKNADSLSKDKIVGKETLKRSDSVVDTYSVDTQSLILAGYGYKFDTTKDGTDLVTISNAGSDEILYIGSTVGSTGTETNGYQLLKGTKVKFENISIKYKDGAKKAFQKYNDLTLENVTLDASECSTMGYVVSNNNGTTTITGKTNITAYKEKVALDVYYWPSEGYKEGISVVFDSSYTGSVSGKIEFSTDKSTTPKTNGGKHSLVIEAGNFENATLVVESFLEGSEIKIKKAVWDVSSVNLPEGYEWKESDGYLTVVKTATT